MSTIDVVARDLGVFLARGTPRAEAESRRATTLTRRQAVVIAVDHSLGTATVTIGGAAVAGVVVQRYAMPLVVGETVWVELAGTDPYVVGHLGPAAWTAITPLLGCANVGGFNPFAWSPAPGGFVQLQGVMTAGGAAVGGVIGVLPAGVLPVRAHVLTGAHFTGATFGTALITVATNGNITLSAGTNGNFLYLDGLRYSLV